jgi:hypothetical protein
MVFKLASKLWQPRTIDMNILTCALIACLGIGACSGLSGLTIVTMTYLYSQPIDAKGVYIDKRVINYPIHSRFGCRYDFQKSKVDRC